MRGSDDEEGIDKNALRATVRRHVLGNRICNSYRANGILMEETKAKSNENLIEKERLSRADVYDIVSMILIGVSLLFSFFQFLPVATRFVQAVIDLGVSFAYYFTENVLLITGLVTPTIGTIPDGIEAVLPFDWEEMQAKLETYFVLFAQKENLEAYLLKVLYDFLDFLIVVCNILPMVIAGIAVFVLVYTSENNNYDEKTKPRKVYEKLEEKVLHPTIGFVRGYLLHIKGRKIEKALKWIWLYNLNVVTIGLEVLAYLFYFSVSFFEIHSFYALIVRVAFDLTVPIAFIPWWLWIIFGYNVFNKMRRKIGMGLLYAYQAANKLFLELYLGALFLVGKQRAKKTTIITDMALNQEVIFREQAYERLATRDKQFPFFPWQSLELFIMAGVESHDLPTLASIREFFNKLRQRFDREQNQRYTSESKKNALIFLRKKYGYTWDDFLFGYDYEKHGLTYNDHLTNIDVFEAIEAYAQLFYIYAAPTSLLFGNYAIRTDILWDDKGNFPVMDADMLSRSPETMEEDSQQSHVARMDCFRLLKVMNPEDPYKDGFEVGVLNMMEMAKERGNQNSNAGVKAGDGSVNAKNDGFEMNIKMQGHASTIDNYTFFRLLLDDQRPDSLSAENKDLCTVIKIKTVDDARIVMPFSLPDELIYRLATSIHDKIYYKLRHLRGDANNTLLVYLMKKLYGFIFRHYDRISKEFGVYVAHLNIWDAMQDEQLTDKGKYYICAKQTYANRFATDGIKQFYHKKALNSEYGLNDFPTFEGKHITVSEMEESESIFYGKLIDAFYKTEMKKNMLQAARNKAKKSNSRQSVAK